MKELVIFDFDDTIVDFQRTSQELISEILKLTPLGEHLYKDVFTFFRKTSEELWTLLEQKQIKPEYLRIERFRRIAQEFMIEINPEEASHHYVNNIPEKVYLLEGVLDTLHFCKSQFKKQGVLTNGFKQMQHLRLKKTKIESLLDFFFTSEDCSYMKPHSQAFWHVLNSLSLTDPKEVIMVGDGLLSDIKGAQALGMTTIWFNRNYENNLPEKVKVYPDYQVNNHDELLKLLNCIA